MAESAQEHLLNHLRDTHAVELQALRQFARAAQGREDEEEPAQAAQEILEQKRQTAEKLAETFDRAAEQLMEDADGDALLLSHLSDVHGIEQQSMQLIRIGIETAGEDEQLKSTYCSHL